MCCCLPVNKVMVVVVLAVAATVDAGTSTVRSNKTLGIMMLTNIY